jgi:hypothetical protein
MTKMDQQTTTKKTKTLSDLMFLNIIKYEHLKNVHKITSMRGKKTRLCLLEHIFEKKLLY